MGTICEHELSVPDPQFPNQSLVEYDLAARLNLTIRRKGTWYQIVEIRGREGGNVRFSSNSLETVIAEANRLEGHDWNKVACRPGCKGAP
jgi:hypothetical protein